MNFCFPLAVYVLISSVYGRVTTRRNFTTNIAKDGEGNALIKIRQSDIQSSSSSSPSRKNKGIFPIEVDISGLVNRVERRLATFETDMNAVEASTETCISRVTSLETKVDAITSDMNVVNGRVETCLSYVPPTQSLQEILEAITHGGDWGTGAAKVYVGNGFILVNDTVSHEEARTRCASNGARLATITSKEEFDFLVKKIALGKKYWVGARALDCPGAIEDCDEWYWPGGEPLPLKWKHVWKKNPETGKRLPYDDKGEDAVAVTITRLLGFGPTFMNHCPKCSNNMFSYICKTIKEL